MKEVRYHSYGDSGVLVYEDADRPGGGPGRVVGKVAGAAFNPVDVAIRAGFMRQVFPLAFPHIPNFDVAGVVGETRAGGGGWGAPGTRGGVPPAEDAAGRARRVRGRAGRCAGRRAAHRGAGRRRGTAVGRPDR